MCDHHKKLVSELKKVSIPGGSGNEYLGLVDGLISKNNEHLWGGTSSEQAFCIQWLRFCQEHQNELVRWSSDSKTKEQISQRLSRSTDGFLYPFLILNLPKIISQGTHYVLWYPQGALKTLGARVRPL